MQKVPVTDCADGIARAQPTLFRNTPRAKTASYTILAGVDFGHMFTNKGAVGAIVLTLPKPSAGWYCGFAVCAAQTLTITATNGATINGSAANGTFAAAGSQNGVGVAIVYSPDGVNWVTIGPVGTWTTT